MAKGSRGGKRGGGKAAGNASRDGALENVSPRTITTTHYLSGSRSGNSYKDEVLEASTDGDGNLTFSYATPSSRSGPSAKTNKTEEVTYTITHGAVNGETVGINWSNVNSITGQTFSLRQEAQKRGFKWDANTKSWRRP